MGRGHGNSRGGPIDGLPGLPWTQGIKSNGFDFARPEPKGIFAAWSQQGLENTLASIDANVKDPRMRQEMKEIVTKMSKEMGGLPVGRDGIKVEIISMNAKTARKFGAPGYGDWYGRLSGDTVYLNKKYFGKGYDYAEKIMTERMTGAGKKWATQTKNPAMTTFVHELGHAYYRQLSSSAEINLGQVYGRFHNAKLEGKKSTKGWGSKEHYIPGKRAEEFYADAVARAVLGSQDKWTRILGSLR